MSLQERLNLLAGSAGAGWPVWIVLALPIQLWRNNA
jgi:hypothetical protein